MDTPQTWLNRAGTRHRLDLNFLPFSRVDSPRHDCFMDECCIFSPKGRRFSISLSIKTAFDFIPYPHGGGVIWISWNDPCGGKCSRYTTLFKRSYLKYSSAASFSKTSDIGIANQTKPNKKYKNWSYQVTHLICHCKIQFVKCSHSPTAMQITIRDLQAHFSHLQMPTRDITVFPSTLI